MAYGLQQEDVDRIHNVFRRYPEIHQAILYGSRALGKQRKASDIDLTLTGSNINLSVISKIETELDDLLLPYTFDLSILQQIDNPSLKNHIDRVGIVFYKKDSDPCAEMSEWEVKELGELVEKIETTDPRKNPAQQFQYVDVSGVSNVTLSVTYVQNILGQDAPSRARRVIRTDDVIFATVRPTLKRIALISSEFDSQICSTGYFVMRTKKELLSKFLFFFLQSDAFMKRMESLQKGASYPAVTDGEVRSQLIPIPTLAEQKRIVAILDEAFEGLATATAHTQQKLQNAQELFQSTLQSTFQQIGKDWTVKKLSEIAESCLGKMLDKRKNKGALQPYLRNKSVRWFDFDLEDVTEMKFEEKEFERYSAKKGDVLICEGGYPGRAAIWESEEPIFFQKAVHRVRFNDPVFNRWLLYLLYHKDFTGELSEHFTGAGIQHFTGKALSNFPIPHGPSKEVDKHVKKLDALSAATRALEALYQSQLTAYTELKQSLLAKAFAGEL
ncbi:MAG: type I restriction enzyme S subunit [Rubritalea sp.]|jgi:type I restriction enzyme S subunit